MAQFSFKEIITKTNKEFQIMGPQDIEETLDAFTSKSKAILLLANRYDGIDLPGDTCHVLVIYGLPAAVNLQERFLWARLGLTAVLKDRIRTRITQAVGRCTRNSTDYALVLMAGATLFDFCIKHENRIELHPELRAEIDFGLDNSERALDELTSLINIFLNKDPSWSTAEEDITKRRDESIASPPSYVETLRSVVGLEVEYQYNLWKEDYEKSLENATQIIDKLAGDELAGYRALWNYFAGCSAFLYGTLTEKAEMIQTAADRFNRASQANKTVSWFARLAHELDTKKIEPRKTLVNIIAAEAINNYLMSLGTVGAKFDKVTIECRKNIDTSDSDNFDRALTELGKMLGFDAEKPEGAGVPDSVWKIGGEYVLLFESKSDETPADAISIRTCRQAQGHQEWLKSRPFFTQNARIFTIIISTRKWLDKDALPHASGLFYQHIEDTRKLFYDVEGCLRNIRSKSPDLECEQRLQLIEEEMVKTNLTIEAIVDRFTSTLLTTLKTNKD